jgi:hypothetical protein
LVCPNCGTARDLTPSAAPITERDIHAALAKLASRHAVVVPQAAEITCGACAATITFTGPLTSSECAFCGTPIQREDVHQAVERLTVDGVLPFRVPHDTAGTALRKWVSSRWFAPTEFTRRGVQGRFVGVYLPFWTFDARTATNWRGLRGDAYWVEVGSGNNRTRERRVNWTRVSGYFESFFDDVVEPAAASLPSSVLVALEPWPLHELRPFTDEVLAGFQARTYDTTLEQGFGSAKVRIHSALEGEVRGRIGGDEQRIEGMDVQFDGVTFKHLLLPVWLLTYRFGDKPFQVAVNATTGEVVGERPWSAVKIFFAVVFALILLVIFFTLAEG